MKTILLYVILSGCFLSANLSFAEAVSDRFMPDFLYDGFKKISQKKSSEYNVLGPSASQLINSNYTEYEWVEGRVFESGVEQTIYSKSEDFFSNPSNKKFYSRSGYDLRIYKEIDQERTCSYTPYQLVYRYGMRVGEEINSSYNSVCNDFAGFGYIKVNKKIQILGYENITTPFGNIDNCLKVEIKYHNTFYYYPEYGGSSGFLSEDTYTHWLALDKEEVKVVITSSGSQDVTTKYSSNLINPHLSVSTIVNNLLLK